LQVVDQVVIEYVPEKAELEDGMDEFRNIFEKFNLLQSAGSEVKGLVFILFYFIFFLLDKSVHHCFIFPLKKAVF